MCDIFVEMFDDEPSDPVGAARRAMRPNLPRRFYASASAEETGGLFAVLLDGRPAKTPARRALAAPNRALGAAIAAEWARQGERVDPAGMPLTRLANSIIDGVARGPDPVVVEVSKYLESDLLFYRAATPEGLVARQAEHWDPVIDWAAEALGARFKPAVGVAFVVQPEDALAHARAAIPADPWRLGAVHSMTTLSGSALLALAVLRRRLDVEQAWLAAHVDEDWNADQWGRDQLALERRAFRFAEMQAAARVIETME